ncbi:MAG: hypothetical protein NT169_22425 [Chloroflexi bacterium]|nr:hypothetical protein [Chloroflexota bacterium]
MQRQQPTRTESGLEKAKRRFDAWRRSHRWLGRIPNELWRLAADTAALHGVEATARRLLVDPARLKQWLPVVQPAEAAADALQFLEFPPLVVGPTAECTLELEDTSGRKLRILLKGPATTQVVALGRMLWKGDA